MSAVGSVARAASPSATDPAHDSARRAGAGKDKRPSMIVAILIGREGSTGFPGKNVYPVEGKPLAEWPLLTASETPEIERIYVSTDLPALKAIACQYGAEVIDRPTHLCTRGGFGRARLSACPPGHPRPPFARRRGRSRALCPADGQRVQRFPRPCSSEGVEVLRSSPELDFAGDRELLQYVEPVAGAQNRRATDCCILSSLRSLRRSRDAQFRSRFARRRLVRRHGRFDHPTAQPRHLGPGPLPQRWMGGRFIRSRMWRGLDVDFAWQVAASRASGCRRVDDRRADRSGVAGANSPPPRAAVASDLLRRPDWTVGNFRDPSRLWLDKNENSDPQYLRAGRRRRQARRGPSDLGLPRLRAALREARAAPCGGAAQPAPRRRFGRRHPQRLRSLRRRRGDRHGARAELRRCTPSMRGCTARA